jgi:hypothetical protein
MDRREGGMLDILSMERTLIYEYLLDYTAIARYPMLLATICA